MGGIAFSPERSWMVKGYIFEAVLGATIEQLPVEEQELRELLTVAIANDGLHLDLLRRDFPDIDQRLLPLIAREARRIASEEGNEDPMLKRECRRLLDLLPT